ncbi:uncharacterized protein LOC101855474 [Aplysia californica]|uniref:Uncharacterized protein LOC101855474 n=1 Tax=Aplysia californica TaxID=6500 RepID=A0ABM0JI65_APLCA|nr:uncharacterized protein LOC101855474 [Aplysia californica]
MAARPNSSGPDSSAGSSADLPPVSGLNKMGVLPEEWTLPHEWKIEKREVFDNWKMDVQSQISNISRNLNSSLQTYPHPEVGSRLHTVDDTMADWEAESQQLKRNRMQLGLSRSLSQL